MTKQELQEYYWLQKNISWLEDKLLELETKATKMTVILTDEPRGGFRQDKLSGLVTKMIDVEKKINYYLQKAYAAVSKVENAIEVLPERERYLIRSKYIQLKSWEQIAVDMNYSWQHIHRLHSEALRRLEKDASK